MLELLATATAVIGIAVTSHYTTMRLIEWLEARHARRKAAR